MLFVYIVSMLVNIASDRITILTDTVLSVLPFRDVHIPLAELLSQWYIDYHHADTIFVLNGPWSFTHLKVGILALQTFAYLSSWDWLYRYSTTFDVYYYAFNEGLLPRYGIVYIGQKKSLAILDCKARTWVLVAYRTIDTPDMFAHRWGERWPYFVDTLFGDDYGWLHDHSQKVSFSYTSNQVILQYSSTIFDVTSCFRASRTIEPRYAIEPSVW